jgi:hypothetical protein
LTDAQRICKTLDGTPAARFLTHLRELLERPYLILLSR